MKKRKAFLLVLLFVLFCILPSTKALAFNISLMPGAMTIDELKANLRKNNTTGYNKYDPYTQQLFGEDTLWQDINRNDYTIVDNVIMGPPTPGAEVERIERFSMAYPKKNPAIKIPADGEMPDNKWYFETPIPGDPDKPDDSAYISHQATVSYEFYYNSVKEDSYVYTWQSWPDKKSYLESEESGYVKTTLKGYEAYYREDCNPEGTEHEKKDTPYSGKGKATMTYVVILVPEGQADYVAYVTITISTFIGGSSGFTYNPDGTTTSWGNVDADWIASSKQLWESTTYPRIQQAIDQVFESDFRFIRQRVYPGELVFGGDPPKTDNGVIQDALSTPGEDGGVSVPAAIVVGVLSGGAAIAGALAAAGSTKDQPPIKLKSYKMYVQKDFGDMLPRGGEPVIIRSRMSEVDENQTERERNDLTAKIAVSANGMTIHNVSMVGKYCEATVSIPKEYAESTASITFLFEGEGGTFTNEVIFNVDVPSIEFYQPNIALKARDEDGAEIGFTVKGLEPDKIKVKLKITGGSSYVAACSDAVTEDQKPVPGTYFAVIADINEDEGEPGTYAVHTLHVTATDGTLTATGEIDIYRVTVGLNIGVNALDCYRVLKKEAAGKEVKDLVASDFDIAYTKAPAFILEYDEEKQEMFYLPAKPEIRFELIDPEDSMMRDRLEGLGLKAILTDIKESMSEYTIYCTKGWLEPPLRAPIKVVAKAVETIGEEEKEYTCEREVMLLSQKKRKYPLTSAQMDEDLRINQWIPDALSFITDNGLMDDLGGEYMLLGTLWDSFDERFGFDPILVAQIQTNINDCLFKRRRYALEQRQRYYEKVQETAYADNNYWTIWSKSFAMVSEKYVDTWGGIATRIALGFCTGGLSEIPFTAMDINKAVSDYNERTLLCDRTTGGKIFYGSVPVMVSVATAGLIKGVGWSVKVMTPAPIKAGLKNWAMRQSQAVMKKIPEKWVYASKKIYSKFSEYAEKINSYDPRKKMLNIRKAAAETDALNLSARAKAQKDVLNVRSGPLSGKGELKSTVQRAGELNAAKKLDRFKKAVDRVKTDPSPKALKELKEATIEMDKDTFALRMLNQEGKTEAEIISKTKIKNPYRAEYNLRKAEFIDDPAEKLIKKKAALKKGVSEDKVVVKRASGKTAEELKEGITSPFDSDNSPMVIDEKTGKTSYFTQAETDEMVAKSYCEATGTSYSSLDDAMKKSSELKAVGVTPDSPEFYMEFEKLKSLEAFSDDAIEANIKTGKFKMAYEYSQMESAWDDLWANEAKRAKVLDECRRYVNREITELSDDTMRAIQMAEKQAECLHQAPKTYDLYVGKDINGQAYGAASGFTEESRVFVETCRLAENQGMYNIDLGEMNDILAKRGTTYSKSVSDMVLDFKTINTNCRAANRSATSGFMNMSPGSGLTGAQLGTAGSVGSSVSDSTNP